MAVDVLKKLKREAKERQRGHQRAPTAVAPLQAAGAGEKKGTAEPGHKYFVSSNWKSLLARKPTVAPKAAAAQSAASAPNGAGDVASAQPDVVAIDCEMVGVGPEGARSVLARVSLVDHEGKVLLDKFVRPIERVTDFRTAITGITPKRLKAPDTIREEEARKLAAELMDGKIVVGHAVHNDFQALMLSHPHTLIRDTSLFKPLRLPGREKRLPSLKLLAEHWLHEKIHEGHHDSVQDAQVALRLYRLKSRLWERQLRSAMASQRRGGRGADGDMEEEEDDGELLVRGGVGAATQPGAGRGARKRRPLQRQAGREGLAGPPATSSDGSAGRRGKRRRGPGADGGGTPPARRR